MEYDIIEWFYTFEFELSEFLNRVMIDVNSLIILFIPAKNTFELQWLIHSQLFKSQFWFVST